MTLINQFAIKDGANLDGFSRLRTSDPTTLWAVQSQYNTNSLMMESGATGTGVAPSHSANTRLISLSATAGSGTSFIQSYQYIPYEPGKSQLIKVTGVMGAAVASAVVDAGSFDANNGHIFRQNGTSGLQFIQRSSTSGSIVDIPVNQSAWSEDKMDGTGRSGITLNALKDFILVIDLQFLGMGRVRMGFDIAGEIWYAHHFEAANILDVPYMQTATLPIQMLVTAASTATTKTAYFKCASVESEGGTFEADAFSMSTPEATETAASGARTHLLSLRPKTTFNGITNRETFQLTGLSMIVTGANPVFWELCIGATIAASTWADVNTTYSAFEYTSVRGAFTNLTNGLVIASGHLAGTGVGATPPTVTPINLAPILSAKYPITIDRAGAVRSLGTMSLLVSGIGGVSVTRASANYKEVR